MFVLAVNIRQHLAQDLQLLHSAGLAIDIAARAPLCSVQATQNTLLIFGLKVLLMEPGFSLINFGYIKGSGNLGAVFAVADGAGIGPIPQCHAQGIQYQGLTRTSFASNRSGATGELDLQGFDQCVVIDMDG